MIRYYTELPVKGQFMTDDDFIEFVRNAKEEELLTPLCYPAN